MGLCSGSLTDNPPPLTPWQIVGAGRGLAVFPDQFFKKAVVDRARQGTETMNHNPSEPTGRISAANLSVPKKRPVRSTTPPNSADGTGLFDRLRDLVTHCGNGSNKHDVAIVLITACIQEGVDTGPRIIATLKHLSFNPRHIAILLKKGTGRDRDAHRWSRAEDGTLHVLQ